MSSIIVDERNGLQAAFTRSEDERPNMAPTTRIGTQLEQVPLGAQPVAVKRDTSAILEQIKIFAAAGGTDYFYSWSTNNKDGTKGTVEGISIDGALTVSRLYGNCDVDCRVEDTGSHYLFYARFTDYETGYRLTRAFQQRKNQNTGMRDADRQSDIVFQIGQSKALRNVIENALRPFTNFAFQEAKGAIVEKVGKNLAQYKERVAARFKDWEIPLDRVERVVARTIDKWVAADVAKVIAQIQAVNDGMANASDLWPAPDVEAPRPKEADFKKDGTPTPAEATGTQGEGASGAKAGAPSAGQPVSGQPPQTDPKGGADDKTKNSGGSDTPSASTSTQQEPASAGPGTQTVVENGGDPQPQDEELDEEDSPAFKEAVGSLEKFVDTLGDPAVELDDAKRRGRAMIESFEGVTEEERDVLRGTFTTATLEEQKKRGKAGKGRGSRK